MEIVIQARDTRRIDSIFGVGVGLILFGLLMVITTQGDAMGESVVAGVLGFSVVVFGLVKDLLAEEQAYDNFTLAAAEQLNIENLTPLGDDEELGVCHMGGESAVSEYSWINEDGDIVKGLIMRSPEQNGECVFALSATS